MTPRRDSEQLPVRVRGPVTGITLPWRLEAGRERHTVIAKATLDLVAGVLRDEPDPPCGDLPGGETLRSSLRYPSDLAPVKPRCEVLVHGSVHGGGRKRVQARFRFGAIERALIAFGPRRYGRSGAPETPHPFDTLPLVWEHAFGGPEQDNPVGCGLGDIVPRIEDPARPIRTRGDRPAPMGWWAVPPLWPQRFSHLGTYDQRWLAERYPYFPEDMDLRFFQSAPPAQQLDVLRGDEPFALEGLHAEHPALAGALPGLGARCAAIQGERFEEVPLRLDTVVFDSDALSAQLVWRGALPANDRRASDVRELYLTLESIGQPLTPTAFEQRYLAERAVEIGLVRQEDSPVLGLAGVAANAPPDPETEALRARIHESLEMAGLTVGSVPVSEEVAAHAGGEAPAPPPVSAELAAQRRAEVEAALERGEPLDQRDLEGVDLTGLVLDGRSLVASDLRRARLSGCSLRGADLRGAQLEGADLRAADLTEAILDAADLQRAQLTGAVLERASLAGASLDEARGDDLQANGLRAVGLRAPRASLSRAKFGGADLTAADLSEADLSEADLSGAELRDVRLYRARGVRARFAEARLVDLRADGADLGGACFDGAELGGAVLDGANLEGAQLRGAVLDEAGLRGVRGAGVQLAGASLRRARLAEAELADASLAGADLMEATLEGARLLRADLRGASLYRAELFEADLRSAQLEGADLGGTRLEVRP